MIDSFTGEYEFLSNFCPVVGGITVEHLFQAAKSTDREISNVILQASTPGYAKRLGRRVPRASFRRDWDSIKYQIMHGLIQWKFSIPEFRSMLLSTSGEVLREGNYWHDTYWGVCWGTSISGGRCTKHSKPEGENWLGRILMEIRRELE